MTYIKKTTNSFKLFYTILAGALLLVWLLLFGTSNSNGDKGHFFQTPRAQADTPSVCGGLDGGCTSVAGDIVCNPNSGGGPGDSQCGNCIGDGCMQGANNGGCATSRGGSCAAADLGW